MISEGISGSGAARIGKVKAPATWTFDDEGIVVLRFQIAGLSADNRRELELLRNSTQTRNFRLDSKTKKGAIIGFEKGAQEFTLHIATSELSESQPAGLRYVSG